MVWQPPVGGGLVRVDLRAVRSVKLHKALQRRLVGMLHDACRGLLPPRWEDADAPSSSMTEAVDRGGRGEIEGETAAAAPQAEVEGPGIGRKNLH